jgi:protein-S-isoprenylcysteine O-methyltransferase Ste14
MSFFRQRWRRRRLGAVGTLAALLMILQPCHLAVAGAAPAHAGMTTGALTDGQAHEPAPLKPLACSPTCDRWADAPEPSAFCDTVLPVDLALVYMYVRLARREEREVLADFGEEYTRSAARTPPFLPRFGTLVGQH